MAQPTGEGIPGFGLLLGRVHVYLYLCLKYFLFFSQDIFSGSKTLKVLSRHTYCWKVGHKLNLEELVINYLISFQENDNKQHILEK